MSSIDSSLIPRSYHAYVRVRVTPFPTPTRSPPINDGGGKGPLDRLPNRFDSTIRSSRVSVFLSSPNTTNKKTMHRKTNAITQGKNAKRPFEFRLPFSPPTSLIARAGRDDDVLGVPSRFTYLPCEDGFFLAFLRFAPRGGLALPVG